MNSIKQIIIRYLEAEYGDKWCWAGKIDDHIRNSLGSKTSNVSRRCRELVKSNLLEVCYEQVDGKGPKCCKYRVKPNDLWQGEISEEEYNQINGLEQKQLI